MNLLINGDARRIALPDNSVNCVVTSPPYYGLRDYQTATWVGGDPECEHTISAWNDNMKPNVDRPERDGYKRQFCIKCGATRVDKQIGLEPTVDEYVAGMVNVFQEIHRVLRDDGTVWLNLGDSYAGSWGNYGARNGQQRERSTESYKRKGYDNHTDLPPTVNPPGLKPKDLIGIPWRVAFALQGFALISIDQIAALCKAIDNRDMPALDYFRAGFKLWEELSGMGWYWNRQDIIWEKTNPMPESIKDRCTKAHEYIFLLTKSARYWYDNEAIKEDSVNTPEEQSAKRNKKPHKGQSDPGGRREITGGFTKTGIYPKRNKRSVWTVSTKPYPGSHYAVFSTDLIEPCILAGCPETVCAKCGAPYERVVESVAGKSKPCPKTQLAHEARGGIGEPVGTVGKSGSGRVDGYTKTLGFIPTCTCDAGTKPGVVLDPFVGSGTTMWVAEKFGRNGIGIDLSFEYLDENARKRLDYGGYRVMPNGMIQEGLF